MSYGADYIQQLFPETQRIRNGELRSKVVQTFLTVWKAGNYARIEDVHQFEPARDRLAYTNVDHTNQVVRLCVKFAEALEDTLKVSVNMDHLLAGALLHDVDKMVIFDAATGRFTPTGIKCPHGVLGAELAAQGGLPDEVTHIIGTHSAKYSTSRPRSLEAFILRHADQLACKVTYLAQGLDDEQVINETAAAAQ
ncbi:MAG: HD domain-containing protein [Candidatus Methylomirabilota bacterium]